MEINKPISILLLLVILLMSLFLFVVPKYQEVNKLGTEIAEKEILYQKAEAYNANIFTLLSSIKEREEVLAKVDSALPSSFQFAPLIYFLQKRSSEHGLLLKSVTFSQSPVVYGEATNETSAAVKEVVFALTISGAYEGMKGFLASLENSARLFEINKISFVSLQPTRSEFGPSAINDFKLEMKAYSYE